MKLAYLDSSWLIAVALLEPGHQECKRRFALFDRILSSNLMEAEYRATLAREGLSEGEHLLSGIWWVFPDRALSGEFGEVLAKGRVRGADLWHLACALSVRSERGSNLTFLTLDERQRQLAAALDFAT